MPLSERRTIGMEALRRHLRYVICSGFVKGERPLSTLILAHPERGKTSEVVKFNAAGCIVANDLTAYGLAEIIEKMSETERKIFHHLTIPDLERIRARSRTVRSELITTLQIAMQEGLTKIRTHFTKLDCNPPIRIGVILCTTPDDLFDRRSVFRRVPFLSRLIPFTYDFSDEKKAEILEYVKQEDHLREESVDIEYRNRADIFMPTPMKNKLGFYARIMASEIESFASQGHTIGKLIGIRALEQLICYLKSIALSNNRPIVSREDFSEFEKLFRYFNFDMNELDYDGA